MIFDFSNKDLYNYKYLPILRDTKRYIFMVGGGGSGKSVFVAQNEIIKSFSKRENTLCIRKVKDTLKGSMFEELCGIIEAWGLSEYFHITKSPLEITNVMSGCRFLFRGMDNPEKIKSIANINRIRVEEATELEQNDFDQLDLRLRGKQDMQIVCTLNPTDAEHWINEKFRIHGDSENVTCLHSTYLDNRFVGEEYRAVMERLMTQNINYYNIYALGQWGVLDGLIFENWDIIKKVPDEARLVCYGLDFGYTNDPTALVGIYLYNNELILDELIYESGLTNVNEENPQNSIVGRLKELGIQPSDDIWADSSEPKSIAEINNKGYNIYPVTKGSDSITYGIDIMKQYKIWITARSGNLQKEFKKYCRAKDKNGKPLNKPIDLYNHCFAGNTKISLSDGYKKICDVNIGDLVLTKDGYKEVLKTFNNGQKQIDYYLLQLDTGFVYIGCTFNHKIYTSQGWTEIGKLQLGQTVCLDKNLIENSIIYIQEKDTFQNEKKECTLLFGKNIIEKNQNDSTYTTRTKTHGTTMLKIWNWLRGRNICRNTLRSTTRKTKNLLLRISTKLDTWLKIGILAKSEFNGTRNMQKNIDFEIKHTETENVKYVNDYTQRNLKDRFSVVIIANQNIEEKAELIKSVYNVQPAQKNSSKTNTQKGDFAIESVVLGITKVYTETTTVYDLMVEGNHQYFANGLLVHNCIDGARYGCMMGLKKNTDLELFVG